jgi:hypothetical protein
LEEGEPRSNEFSRGDLDRVIRRAAELQFEEAPDRDGTSKLNETEILRIGSEVGIENRFLRQAMGELRAEQLLPAGPAIGGWLSRVIGEPTMRTYRVVPGSVDQIDVKLGEHLRVAETLSPVRDRQGYSLWEPDRGFFADLRRGLKWRGYRYELARVNGMHVNLQPMEDGFVLTTMTADLRRLRAANTGGAMGGIGLGLGTVGLVLGLTVGLPVLAIPAALVGAVLGAGVARASFRRVRTRVQLTMEGILDRLESGGPLASKALPSPSQRLHERLRERRHERWRRD